MLIKSRRHSRRSKMRRVSLMLRISIFKEKLRNLKLLLTGCKNRTLRRSTIFRTFSPTGFAFLADKNTVLIKSTISTTTSFESSLSMSFCVGWLRNWISIRSVIEPPSTTYLWRFPEQWLINSLSRRKRRQTPLGASLNRNKQSSRAAWRKLRIRWIL